MKNQIELIYTKEELLEALSAKTSNTFTLISDSGDSETLAEAIKLLKDVMSETVDSLINNEEEALKSVILDYIANTYAEIFAHMAAEMFFNFSKDELE